MRRLDANPDVNEVLNYNGARRLPDIPDLPAPKGLVPRPALEDDGGWVLVMLGLMLAMGVLVWLVVR